MTLDAYLGGWNFATPDDICVLVDKVSNKSVDAIILAQ
jgi:hypothetical protein